MSSKIISFPQQKTTKFQHDQAESALMEDPNYKFIHDLLTAVSEIGLPIDGAPSQKAREVYAKCQRENVFANLEHELISRQED